VPLSLTALASPQGPPRRTARPATPMPPRPPRCTAPRKTLPVKRCRWQRVEFDPSCRRNAAAAAVGGDQR